MKTNIKNLFLLPMLIAGFSLVSAGRVTAQTFTTLHSFSSYPDDGDAPSGGVILSGNTLYGTTDDGGYASSDGTVYKVNTDGTGFTTLLWFGVSSGTQPRDGLILSGNTLYGTTTYAGNSYQGTVFKVSTDGSGFSKLHDFGGSDSGGAWGVILSGNTLYGTTYGGNSPGKGTVFKLNTDGTGFINLHTFEGGSDGAYPSAGLILSGSTLYGMTQLGGNSHQGTVFKVNTDGTAFTNLHAFGGSDGAQPRGGLILSDNTLYGTATEGGSSGNGTVFKVNTDGSGFTNLHSFTGGSDGANPWGVILSGNTLYGTAYGAYGSGSSGKGTVFAVKTDGTGFMNLHNFSALSNYTNSDGANPRARLILSGTTLYGTATTGGSSGYGTVFSLSFAPPQLTIKASDSNVILTWPTIVAGFDYTGFTLQSTTNLVSPAVWSTVSPGPVAFNGQNTVTNPISGPQQFYRLSQ